ncbi:MAG: HEAT repeat domain-containing protein [Planctomycetota bacterium]|nr:HEAT repeat domain-containing protein [Planctomycetota bacterium]
MDIHFCDLCNESVPASDFAIGRAFRRKGRVVCAQCDAAMGGARSAGSESSEPAAPSTSVAPPPVTASSPSPASTELAAEAPAEAARAWPGVFGLMAGTAALVAVGVGGVLVLDRLDGIQGESQAIRSENQRAKSDLRAEQRAALAPLREEITAAADRTERAAAAAAEAQSARIAQLEQQLAAASSREAELRASIEAVRALVGESRRAVDAERARDAVLVAKIDQVVEFHGNRLIDLEERIREAGALVAAGVVPPGAAGTPDPSAGPAWEPLVAELASEDAAVRLQAAYDLGETGDTAVVPHLLPMLSDADVFVRMVTAQALDTLQARLAVPALIARLGDDTITVREAALIALRNITGQRFGYEPDARQADRDRKLEQWRTWWRREGDDFLSGGGG